MNRQEKIQRPLSDWSSLGANATLRKILGSQIRRGLFAIIVFSTLYNVLILATPVFIVQVYSRVLTSQSIETLLVLTLAAAVALVFASVFDVVRQSVLQRVSHQLYVRLGENVVHASLVSGQDSSGGERPLRDVDAIRRFVGGREILSMIDVPFASLFLVILFLIHPLIGLITAVIAIVMCILALAQDRLSDDARKKVADDMRRSSEEFGSFAARRSDVAGLGMIKPVVAGWLGAQVQQADALRASDGSTVIVSGISRAIRHCLQIVILAVASYFVIKQELNPGMIIASSILATRAVTPFESLVGGRKNWNSARDGYRRLRALLAAAPVVEQLEHRPRTGAAEVANLVYVPPSPGRTQPALRGVDLQLQTGEILGIVGPSGSGKSILGRLLVGALEPTAGWVKIDGVDLKSCDRYVIGRSIGYLPQRVDIFPGTIGENVARFDKGDADMIWQAIRLCGADRELGRFKLGLDTPMQQAAVELSPGSYKRLLLARAFFGSPKLIVLDEPNADLDLEGEQILISAIRHMRDQGASIVMLSPRANLAGCADRMVVLKSGMIDRTQNRADPAQSPLRSVNPPTGIRILAE